MCHVRCYQGAVASFTSNVRATETRLIHTITIERYQYIPQNDYNLNMTYQTSQWFILHITYSLPDKSDLSSRKYVMCPDTVEKTSYWYVNHTAPHATQYQFVTDGSGIDIKVREIIMSRQVCITQVCKIIDGIICQITYPNPNYNPDATKFSNGNCVNIRCWSRVRNIFIARYKNEWYIYVIWDLLIAFISWYIRILWLHYDV